MLRLTLLTALLAATAPALLAQSTEEAPPVQLVGKIAGETYIAAGGNYTITIPVLPELGGTVDDTPQSVHFQDTVSTFITVACLPMDATQSWLHETKGKKDFLSEFFVRSVHSEFAQQFPGSKIESARFIPSVQNGALLTFNLIPGGTMFNHRITLVDGDPIPVAKRGNLLFVRDNHVYIISTELVEKVVERSTYTKTTAEEDDILRKRLLGVLDKMTFVAPPPATK